MPGLPPSSPAVEAAYKRYIPFAQQAGFSGDSLVTIMAIAFGESGLDPAATHTNGDGSIDRGILQINSKAHPEVTDGCAFDPGCAFHAAWTISQQGKNFTAWDSYKNSTTAYQTGVADLQAILTGNPIPNPDVTAGTQTASTGTGNLPGVAGDALGSMFGPLLAALPGYGIHIGLFMLALMLVIVGFWIVSQNPGKAK